jgi:phytanoyl-CoA hydroxylase
MTRLDLGCGSAKRDGFIGLDHVEGPDVDHVLDLTKDPYPFADQSVDEVYSAHFLEHIEEPNHVFEQIGRICKDHARIEFWTPYAFTKEAFLYGHLQYITEEMWLHLCVSHRDLFVPMLKGRWLLRNVVYVIDQATIDDLAGRDVELGFAVRYFKDVVTEIGVEIEFRSDLSVPPIIPTSLYATSRFGERHLLATADGGSRPPSLSRWGFRSASQRLRKLAGFVLRPLRSHGGAEDRRRGVAMKWPFRTKNRKGALSPEQREFWDENGYLVLPGFFPEHEVARINDVIETAWRERRQPDNPTVIDVLVGPEGERRMYFRDAPDDAKDRPYKLNDLYLLNSDIREFVLDRRLVAVLRDLIGGDPAVCNSLNFEYGSEQDYHFDTYYMPGPCKDGLVVTSIYLEDVHPDAGPLTFFPGSHRIPPYRFSHGGIYAAPDEMEAATEYARRELQSRSLTAEEFMGKKGDVFIWHEQLYHGGRPINDASRTRRSLVTHYWRADALQLDPGWTMRSIGQRRFYLDRFHQPVPEPS